MKKFIPDNSEERLKIFKQVKKTMEEIELNKCLVKIEVVLIPKKLNKIIDIS